MGLTRLGYDKTDNVSRKKIHTEKGRFRGSARPKSLSAEQCLG